ncbi:MAG: VanZ family protein [Dehalococcoidia bacterium]
MQLFRVAAAVVIWGAVLGWMGLIFYASEQPDAGEMGASVPLFGLLPDWTWEWVVHGALFAVLTALTYAATRISLPWPWPVAALLALAIAIGYGGLDEWHQSLVPGRSADIRDVGRDAVGALGVILLARAITMATVHLLHRRWIAFGRVTSSTLVVLEGMGVIWVTALWMVAGPEHSFSLASLEPSDFLTAVIHEPLALAVGIPFFGVVLWMARGFARTVTEQMVLLVAPTASALVALGIPFASYGLNVVPDRESVWMGTWIATGAAWALAVPLVAALRWRGYVGAATGVRSPRGNRSRR